MLTAIAHPPILEAILAAAHATPWSQTSLALRAVCRATARAIAPPPRAPQLRDVIRAAADAGDDALLRESCANYGPDVVREILCALDPHRAAALVIKAHTDWSRVSPRGTHWGAQSRLREVANVVGASGNEELREYFLRIHGEDVCLSIFLGACSADNAEVCRAMIKWRAADLGETEDSVAENLFDDDDNALDIARHCGRAVAQLLREYGAIDARDLLRYAARARNCELCEIAREWICAEVPARGQPAWRELMEVAMQMDHIDQFDLARDWFDRDNPREFASILGGLRPPTTPQCVSIPFGAYVRAAINSACTTKYSINHYVAIHAIESGVISADELLRIGAQRGHKSVCDIARSHGARDVDAMLRDAAAAGNHFICARAIEWGARDLRGMYAAAQEHNRVDTMEYAMQLMQSRDAARATAPSAHAP